MKSVARLALFFTVFFAAAFVSAALVRFLQIRIDVIRAMPPRNGELGGEMLGAFRWALPTALYISLLFSLSYAARHRIFSPAAMLCLLILGSAVSLGVTAGAESFSRLARYFSPPRPMEYPGLILTQADNAIVLIRNPADPWGPRVVSIPEQPLLYQELPRGPDGRPIPLPPIPFRTGTAWVLQSFIIDLSLASREWVNRFDRGSSGGGLLPFLVYSGALVFLLASLRFALGLSNWPLANLFLGALIFRGILSLEVFLGVPEVEDVLNGLLGELIPPLYTAPLIFASLGFLVCLYSFLSFLARRRDSYED
ncbi:MAG: hypothetical protein LBL56_03090 [Treponema sp.]|jgi:hypothetical protein|nr:hypothetical protein [Treponema sp.]